VRDRLAALIAAVVAACAAPADRAASDGATASAPAAADAGDSGAPGAPPAWSPAFGDVIVFAVGDQAVLQRPAAAGLLTTVTPGGELQLLSRGGATAGRWTGAADTVVACRGGVAVTIDGSATWALGLEARAVTPLALVGLDAGGRGDSARVVAEITRLVAALPDDSTSAFASAPFVVRDAVRFTPDTTVEAVAAVLTRTLPVEADPRAEFVVVIAERNAGRPRGGWAVAYVDRTAGAEDVVETPDLLAAVRMHGTALPTLFVGADGPEGTQVRLLERAVTGGAWRERWRSDPASCR
jgi:hypothetical protein